MQNEEERDGTQDEPKAPPKAKKEKKTLRQRYFDFARSWFPAEDTEVRAVGKKAFPTRYFVAVLILTLTLLLVVGSSVLVAQTKSQVEKQRNEIERLAYEREMLENKLKVKNDLLRFENIARNELGMVSDAYITQHYVSLYGEEGIENYKDTDGQSGLSALVDVFK